MRVALYSNSNIVVDKWFRAGVLDQEENYRVIGDTFPTAVQYRASVGRIFADGFEP